MVAFVSVVAFCGLLWSFVTSRCFCMMVCGAKCHFYGHCRILWYLWQLWHLWWYSWVAVHFEFVSGGYCPTLLIWPAVWGFLHQDVSPAVWGFFKLMMFRLQFWDAFLIQNFSPAVSGWRLLNSRCFTWAQACPWCVLGVCVSWMQQAMRFLRNSFQLCTWFTIHRLGADLDYNVIVEHVFVMTSWFSTPLPG